MHGSDGDVRLAVRMTGRRAPKKRVDRALLETYPRDNWILERLERAAVSGDNDLTCHLCLAESGPKHIIYSRLYGNLLKGEEHRALNAGAGLT